MVGLVYQLSQRWRHLYDGHFLKGAEGFGLTVSQKATISGRGVQTLDFYWWPIPWIGQTSFWDSNVTITSSMNPITSVIKKLYSCTPFLLKKTLCSVCRNQHFSVLCLRLAYEWFFPPQSFVLPEFDLGEVQFTAIFCQKYTHFERVSICFMFISMKGKKYLGQKGIEGQPRDFSLPLITKYDDPFCLLWLLRFSHPLCQCLS